ncbi:MAG: prohead core protein [Thiomicrorhabdus sp.]|nr:prohead core protein [Thiomicrorhabdus sp.]
MFLELLEQHDEMLDEDLEDTVLDLLADAYHDDMSTMQEDLELSDEDYAVLSEALTKHVSSTGKVTKTKSLKSRKRHASVTKGMSKSKLRQIARKGARTKKKNPGGMRKAMKKRKKALKRRKNMGMK